MRRIFVSSTSERLSYKGPNQQSLPSLTPYEHQKPSSKATLTSELTYGVPVLWSKNTSLSLRMMILIFDRQIYSCAVGGLPFHYRGNMGALVAQMISFVGELPAAVGAQVA